MIIKGYRAIAIAPGHITEFAESQKRLADNTRPESDRPDSRILQMADGVGVIEVKGTLVNTDSYWNRMFGMISYNEIRTAAIEAVDLGAGSILFDVDSPGGSVAGCRDLSSFISSLDIKTISHTSGAMSSAAYLGIGLATDHIFQDDMAETGSVGVVATLIEYSEAMKKQGVTALVFRSGKHKQAGNPYEKLTAENSTYIQGQIDKLADKFFSLVSERRHLTLAALEANEITTGKTFIGEEAVHAGLVDDIKTFDQTLQYAYDLAEKYLDRDENTVNYYGNQSQTTLTSDAGGNMKKLFSPQAVAALVKPGDETPPAPGATETVKPEEELKPPVKTGEAEADAETTPEVPEDLEALKTLNTELTGNLAVATEALATAEKSLGDATAATADLQVTFDAAMETSEKLKLVIAEQVSVMRSAMALPAADYKAVSAEDVLAAFETTAKSFNASMPTGGIIPDPKADDAVVMQTSRNEANAIKNLGLS